MKVAPKGQKRYVYPLCSNAFTLAGRIYIRLAALGIAQASLALRSLAQSFHTKIICAVVGYNGCFYFVFIYSLRQ